MTSDAIKALLAGSNPPEPETMLAAANEAVDLLVGFFANVERIANAAEEVTHPGMHGRVRTSGD